MPETAVLGFRPHTYWTAAVALAADAGGPRVVERRRIEFAEASERFVYHQAADDPAGAPERIENVRRAVRRRAAGAIGELIDDLQRRGTEVRMAVIPSGTSAGADAFEDIIRVHARMHAAEGRFYREAVVAACEGLGLEVRRGVEKSLAGLGCEMLGLGERALDNRLRELGAGLGPPWTQDYRLAALAAWLHLGAGVSLSSGP